jgi:hypothetical protein
MCLLPCLTVAKAGIDGRIILKWNLEKEIRCGLDSTSLGYD